LKSRGVTHIVLSYSDLKRLDMISALGSDEKFDRLFRLIPLTPLRSGIEKDVLRLSPIASQGEIIEVRFSKVKPEEASLVRGSDVFPIKYIWYRGVELKSDSPSAKRALILFKSPSKRERWRGFLLPEYGYRSLIIQLLLLNHPSSHFTLVYRNDEVYIWQVKYLKGIAPNPSYLVQHFPDNELRKSWMFAGYRHIHGGFPLKLLEYDDHPPDREGPPGM